MIRASAPLMILALAGLAGGCASSTGLQLPTGARHSGSEHFGMESAVSPEASRRILEVSEEAWTVFSRLTGEPAPSGVPVTIYVYATGEDFSRAVPPGVGERTAGAWVPSQHVLGFACDERAIEHSLPRLRHELFHAWVGHHTAGARLPEFLSEGLSYYVTWCDWPPADDRIGAEEVRMVYELEYMAFLGHSPSLPEVLAESSSRPAEIRAGEIGTRDYHAVAAFLMRMILLDSRFRGFLPKLFAAYAASGPMTGGETCELFTKSAAEFLGDPAALQARYEETLSRLRVLVLGRLAKNDAQLALLLHTTTLVPARDGVRFDPAGLTLDMLRSGKGLSLFRDPGRSLPRRAEEAIRTGRDVGKRADGIDPAGAPAEFAAEVAAASKALLDFESTLGDLKKLMGEDGYLMLERAATPPGSSGPGLGSVAFDSQLLRAHLDGWLSRRGGR